MPILRTANLVMILAAVSLEARAVNPWPQDNLTGSVSYEHLSPAAIAAQQQAAAQAAQYQAAQAQAAQAQAAQAMNASNTGANANANTLPQFLQQLNSGPGGAGGFGSFPGFNSGIDSSGHPFVQQVPGSGRLEPCGNIPQGSHVAKARDEAVKFREQCAIAQRGGNQKIAVNDYSSSSTPYMYIFDVNGKCLHKTAVSYGNGAGPVRPLPCSRGGSKLTPPGMHITAPHKNGSAYNEANSTLMVGLEGQESAGRGILIHYGASAGTASSWGCSGVGPYDQVRAVLGYGSLVYNYFGETRTPNGCETQAGMGPPKPASCRTDRAATAIPTFSTSTSAPEVNR